MRDTGCAEDLPIGPVDGVLVAHHQRGNQSGCAPVAHLGINGVLHPLAHLLHGVAPGCVQTLRRSVFGTGTHVAGSLQPLLPKPQFVIETVRIAVAVRRLEPHRHLPAFAGPQIGRLALQGQHGIGFWHHTGIPAQVHAGRYTHSLSIQRGGFHREAKPQARLIPLGHGGYHARHRQVFALQRGGERLAGKHRCPQACQSKTQTGGQQQCHHLQGQVICYVFRSYPRIQDEG